MGGRVRRSGNDNATSTFALVQRGHAAIEHASVGSRCLGKRLRMGEVGERLEGDTTFRIEECCNSDPDTGL